MKVSVCSKAGQFSANVAFCFSFMIFGGFMATLIAVSNMNQSSQLFSSDLVKLRLWSLSLGRRLYMNITVSISELET